MARNMRKTKPLYLDASQPADARTRDLLGRMTLEEKICQMGFANSLDVMREERFCPELAETLFQSMGIGGLQDPRTKPSSAAACIRAVQQHLLRKTRLGIPALIVGEGLHGS